MSSGPSTKSATQVTGPASHDIEEEGFRLEEGFSSFRPFREAADVDKPCSPHAADRQDWTGLVA